MSRQHRASWTLIRGRLTRRHIPTHDYPGNIEEEHVTNVFILKYVPCYKLTTLRRYDKWILYVFIISVP